MNYIEFLHNRDKYLGENHDDFLMHYGILGQKWGQRHWQNPDGTYTTEGKIRYFGSKKAQAEMNADETKIGSKTSDAKDYLKFRNKMLKERTRPDLNEWYRDKNKYLDKQLVRDAKRVDKQQQKMYKNQLKDWYDNPEDLVSDLNAMYKIGGKDQKIGGLFSKKAKDYNYYNNKYEDETVPYLDKLRDKIEKNIGNNLEYSWAFTLKAHPRFEKFGNRRDLNIINDNAENINNMLNSLKANDTKTYNEIINKISDPKIKDVCKDYANELYNAEVDGLKEKFFDRVIYNEDDLNSVGNTSYKVTRDVLDDELKNKSFNKLKEDMENKNPDIAQKIKDESEKYNKKIIKERFGSEDKLYKIAEDSRIDNKLFYSRPHDKKWDKIADIGLKASKRIDMDDEDYKSDPNAFREWFMFEDQTFGMPQLAKLYYEGYSKKQINNLIDQVFESPYHYYDGDDKKKENLSNIAFNLYEGFRDEKDAKNYVDALFELER